MKKSVPLGILDRSVPSGSVVYAFCTCPEGRDAVVLPFLAEGLRTGQAHSISMVIVDGVTHDDPYYIEPGEFSGGSG
jgi:hypothetical protein